ncbi:hypothetical protein M5K25_000177 [Dendrobium thyrsiflorum]|uniref:TLDc domain-containing protein n=1 Tax=Dendrobium thyrsiflorum TaxID=117978 RepID=A0ABD0VTA4_DENTH
MSASSTLVTVYRIFSDVCWWAGIACGLEFDLEDADDGKSSRLSMWGKGGELALPDLSHLVLSTFLACGFGTYIVEGYRGPLLFLFSGNLADSSDDKSSTRWVVGVLTGHGFQNTDMFYGTSAHLYTISSVFRVLSPTGKEKNFLYNHLHPTGRVYEANPKPASLAFGGTRGSLTENYEQFIDGYLLVEASLVEAEVWDFGESSTKEQHDTFKKREKLFTEQRRKVDMKTFDSWEDSPENMMMDMVSDPNRIRQEDR